MRPEPPALDPIGIQDRADIGAKQARPKAVPKISCLMVTRGHLSPAQFAVACYRRQTYANRELIVLCDRPENPLARWLATLDDPTIRYFETKPAVLGALRNLSVEAATGDLLCQWDDDDLCHPRRLEAQQGLMAEAGASVHFLSQWTLWWPERRILGLSAHRVWEGSMLVERTLLPSYPEQALGEDTATVRSLIDHNRVALHRRPALYCYVVHGANSWDDAHFERMFRRTQVRILEEHYERQLERMTAYYPVQDYAAWLQSSATSRTQPINCRHA